MAVGCGKMTLLAISLAFSSSVVSRAAQHDDLLPPPPDARRINAEAVYHLSLVVNHYETNLVIPVTRRPDGYYISRADLQRGGLPVQHLTQGEVNVSALADVDVEYDDTLQRLLLTVPVTWLPERLTALREGPRRIRPQSGQGGLLNYDFYTSESAAGQSQLSLWHELRYFTGSAALSSTGYVRQNLRGDSEQQGGYIRYDTTLSYTDDDNAIEWSLGDVISDALSWSSSVRIGGLRYGRDFSLRPDLVTWPIPAFSGDTAVPTSVDVFIDGYRSGSTQLQPGPFTLTNLPYVNGAGDAVLVTTDAMGRQVTSTMPFYVSSELLKQGLSDGAFTLGALRRNYGIKNVDYGPVVASGSYRYGVSDWLTFEGHAEGAGSLALAGAGGQMKLGYFGVLNGALTQSRMRGKQGHQLNWGYQYSAGAFSFATQHTLRDKHFGSLAIYDQPPSYDTDNQPISSLSQRSEQYSLSLSMGQFGSIGAAWIGVRSFDQQKTELLNFSWSRNIWGNSSLYLSASHDRQKDDWTLAMSVQIPLGEQDNIAINTEHTPDAGQTQRITYNHTMSPEGGFGGNLAWARQSQSRDYQQGTLSWRNRYIELQGGGYGEGNTMTWWGEVMGSLVLMDNQLFAANKINDAFVVVSTDGYSGVPVRYENQQIGETSEDGYLLVSGVSAWYPTRYSIDALNLPADTQLKETEQRVALRRGSGYLLEFPITQQRAASVILHDEAGQPLPVASQVLRTAHSPAVVGYDGIAWLDNLSEINPMTVLLPDGHRCTALLTLPEARSHQLQTWGPVTCKVGS